MLPETDGSNSRAVIDVGNVAFAVCPDAFLLKSSKGHVVCNLSICSKMLGTIRAPFGHRHKNK